MSTAAKLQAVSLASLSSGSVVGGVRLGAVLGRGATSCVFNGQVRGHAVAVKLQEADVGSTAAATLAREAAILARIDHPGVVRVHEVGVDRGIAFLAMEFAGERSLARQLVAGPLHETRVLELAYRLAAALEAVHAKDVVHRDVKPANILLRDDGSPVLIDFNLAARADAATVEDVLVGSPLYCSPEQGGVFRRPVDPRADLYALGVVLFECLTGSPPYRGDGTAEILRQHAFAPVPSPATLSPATSPELCQLVVKLLAKDPDDRPRSAHGLMQEIEALAPKIGATLACAMKARRDGEAAVSPARSAELNRLEALVGQVRRGRGGTVLVLGEAGSGKSRFIAAALEASAADRLTHAKVIGCADDTGPLAHLRALVRQTLEAAAPDPAAAMAARDLDAAVPGFLTAAAASGTDIDQRHLAAATAEFFRAIAAATHGLLLVLEDVDGLDSGSRATLERCSESFIDHGILLLATARDAGAWRAAAEALQLAALTAKDVETLARRHLGGHPLAPQALEALVAASQGNPRVALDFLDGLLDGGWLRYSWGTWTLAPEAPRDAALTRGVAQVMSARVASLDAASAAVLAVAALAAASFSHELLVRIVGAGAILENALAEGLRRRVLRRDGDRLAFTHGELRDALTARLTDGERAAGHQRIALAYAAETGTESDIYAAASHYARGTGADPGATYRTNLEAGLKARALAAFAASREYLGAAAAHRAAAGVPEDPALLEALGDVALKTNRLTEAVRFFERALELLPRGPRRAETWLLMAQVHETAMRARAAIHCCHVAMAELDIGVPRRPILRAVKAFLNLLTLVVILPFRRLQTDDAAKTRRLDLMFRIALCTSRNAVMAVDHTELLYAGLAYTRVALLTRSVRARILSRAVVATSIATISSYRVARPICLKAQNDARATGDRALLASTLMYDGIAMIASGETRSAFDALQRCVREHRDWMHVYDYGSSASLVIFALISQGRMREAFEWGRELTGIFADGDTGDTPSAFVYGAFLGGLYAVVGREVEAMPLIARASFLEKLINEPDVTINWAIILMFRALFLISTGDLGSALDELEKVRAQRIGARPMMPMLPVLLQQIVFAQACLEAVLRKREGASPEHCQRLRRATAAAWLCRVDPSLAPHLYVLRAACKWLDGKIPAAEALLARAEAAALKVDCAWVVADVFRIRAHIAHARGQARHAERLAAAALDGLREIGFVALHRAGLEELSVLSRSGTARPLGSFGEVSSTARRSVNAERYLKALLEVSLASSRTLEPMAQARAVLDKLISILGGERAFLFLVVAGDEAKEPQFAAGRDAEGKNLAQPTGFSSSVIRECWRRRRALIVSAGEDGDVDGAESVVAHALRSIIAAPLIVGDKTTGVLYLDSRVARGIFTQDTADILSAAASQVAVILDIGRLANLEVAAKALEKDLEVAAAVQALLLPTVDRYENAALRLKGCYRAAAQTGGDWWTYAPVAHDAQRVGLFLGDVTGHGAGAAMITAAMAGCFETLGTAGSGVPAVRAQLLAASQTLRRLGNEQYLMTGSYVEIDPERAQIHVVWAGAPPVLRQDRDGRQKILSGGGSTPLGWAEDDLAEKSFPFASGDRLFVFSDGVSELRSVDGKELGLLGVKRLLEQTRGMDFDTAFVEIGRALEVVRQDRGLEDDLTYVLVEAK